MNMVGINTSYTSRATSTASVNRSQPRTTGSTSSSNNTNKPQTTKKPQIDSFSPSRGTSNAAAKSTPAKSTPTTTKPNNIFSGSAPRTSSKPTQSSGSSTPRTGSFGSLTTSTRTSGVSGGAKPTRAASSSGTTSTRANTVSGGAKPTRASSSSGTTSTRANTVSGGAKPTRALSSSGTTSTRANTVSGGAKPTRVSSSSGTTSTRANTVSGGAKPTRASSSSGTTSTRANTVSGGARPSNASSARGTTSTAAKTAGGTTQTTTKPTIDYNKLAKNFTTQADKDKFTDIIKNLPQEVQADIAKEINNMRPANADEYGTFNPINNNLAVTLDDHAKFIIAHEVGHSVDTVSTNVNGITVNQSSLAKLISEDKNFAATYQKELEDFLAAYKDEFGTDHPWVTSYPTEHYPTEAFATYYRHETLGYEKTTASGKDWADLMISKMPETTKAIANLIEKNRNLSDDERQAKTEKYYDNGQIKSSVTTNNGIVYADGYNEDGSKAYQIQIYPDGTEQYIIDNYDANGNKLEPTYYTVKPQDKEQHGGGGRRR